MLKVDLQNEDIPGGETAVGVLLLIVNMVIPPTTLLVALVSFGLESKHTAQDIKPTDSEGVVAVTAMMNEKTEMENPVTKLFESEAIDTT